MEEEFPYFSKTEEDLNNETTRKGLLWSYRRLAFRFSLLSHTTEMNHTLLQSTLHFARKCVLISLFHLKLDIPLTVRVREHNGTLFKIITITKRTMTQLHFAISTRLEVKTPIKSIILLPDTLIEKDQDLYLLEEESKLEVHFEK